VSAGAADLVVDRLTVEYDSGGYLVRPLHDFSMRAGDGQLVVLHGPSGCGKTTLLSVLAGLLKPAAGEASFAGRTVTGLGGEVLLRHRRFGVGVVFQAFNLVPSLTALENVMAPLVLAGTRRRDAHRRAARLLADLDLADRSRHRPGRLSGGQQQRVAFARALVHDPPLLLADEPTAHLDHIQVETVLRLLRTLARPGRLVLVATHDDRVSRLADAVVELAPLGPRRDVTPADVDLAAGEVLFQQGDQGDVVYVVEEGRVEIVRIMADRTERPVNVCGPGEWFGELAALTGLPRSATARAMEASRLTSYGVVEFRRRQSRGGR
jgi:putative ABC transport system ATP-binding protein